MFHFSVLAHHRALPSFGCRLFHKTLALNYVKVTRSQTAEQLDALPNLRGDDGAARADAKRSRKTRTEVFAWGYSGTGALGEPRLLPPMQKARLLKEAKNRKRPMRMKAIRQDMDVVDVAAGFGFTVIAATVAKQPYVLFGCGLNSDSQLGYQKARPSAADSLPLVAVGNLVPISLPIDTKQKFTSKRNQIIKVAAGRAHTLALSSAGTVYSLGNNAFGQCGRPIVEGEQYFGSHKVHSIRFDRFADDPIVKIVCGQDHSLFLTQSGRVLACGWAADGQLGNGSYRSSGEISQVIGDLQGEKIVDISSAADCCLAISEQGNLFGWGNSEYGQLGTPDTQVATARHLSHFEAVLDRGDSVVGAGAGGSMATLLTKSGRVYAWGFGLLGLGPSVRQAALPTLIKSTLFGDRPVRHLVAGVNRMAAINDQGQLFTWGANSKAQLGVGGQVDLSYPMPVLVAARVDKVSLGIDHTVAMGSNRV